LFILINCTHLGAYEVNKLPFAGADIKVLRSLDTMRYFPELSTCHDFEFMIPARLSTTKRQLK